MLKVLGKRGILYRVLMYLFRIFPVNSRKIIFDNFNGNSFGGNPKYVAMKIHELAPEYKIYWTVKKHSQYDFPEYIHPVYWNSIRLLYCLSTAKVWIDNVRKPAYSIKRKSQYYIQLWHGDLGLKKVEADIEQFLSPEYVANAKHDAQLSDVMTAGSRWYADLLRRAFWFSGNIEETGMPRADVFFQDKTLTRKKVEDAFHLHNKKLVLYAPTFRNSGDTSPYQWDYARVISAFSQYFQEDTALLFRLHPNLQDSDFLNHCPENVINATSYPDMQELLVAADALITDYSSSIFEFMLTDRPAFLFSQDHENYIRSERSMYFDLKELPFPFVETEDALVEAIGGFDQDAYHQQLKEFYKAVGLKEDGHGSERIANIVFQMCHDEWTHTTPSAQG